MNAESLHKNGQMDIDNRFFCLKIESIFGYQQCKTVDIAINRIPIAYFEKNGNFITKNRET